MGGLLFEIFSLLLKFGGNTLFAGHLGKIIFPWAEFAVRLMFFLFWRLLFLLSLRNFFLLVFLNVYSNKATEWPSITSDESIGDTLVHVILIEVAGVGLRAKGVLHVDLAVIAKSVLGSRVVWLCLWVGFLLGVVFGWFPLEGFIEVAIVLGDEGGNVVVDSSFRV